MSIVVSVDHTFGLKGIDPDKISIIISEYTRNLRFCFMLFLSFVVSVIFVKLICLWLEPYNKWFLFLICRLLVMFIGGFFVRVFFQFGKIIDMFGFMAIGAEISSALKAKLRK